MKRIAFALLAATLICGLDMGAAQAAEATQDLDKAFDFLATYTFGGNRAPLEVISAAARAAQKDAAAAKALEARLLEVLASGTVDAKRFICRKLAVMGSAEAVPALVGFLQDAAMAESALHALEAIPDREAGKALREALDAAPAAVKPGIFRVLGARGELESVPVIVDHVFKLIEEGDAAGARDAAAALAGLGYAPCDAVFRKHQDGDTTARRALDDACLACAAAWEEAENADKALAIYEALFAPEQPGHVRGAALEGLVQMKPDEAVARIMQALRDGAPEVVQVAGGLVRTAPGEEATRAFAGLLGEADEGLKLLLISALADRGDVLAGPAVKEAAASEDKDVEIAAISALGRVGDASCAELLLQSAAEGAGERRRVARASLSTLPGPGVDEALLDFAQRGAVEVRVEALQALADRRAMEAKDPLLKLAREEKELEVGSAVLKALQVLTSEQDLPALTALLEGVEDAELRAEMEKTVVAVAQRIPEPARRTAVVLDKLAAADKQSLRISLLRILGDLPGEASLAALRSALGDPDERVRLAALDKLSAWPDAAPLDDLRAVAKAPKSAKERGAAFSGYVRLLRGAQGLSASAALQRYAEALEMSESADEKKAVLAGLAEVSSLEALALAEKLRQDAAVAAEANLAVLRIAQAICGAYPKEAVAAVEPFLAGSAEENQRAQAKAVQAAVAGFGDYVSAWEVSGPYTQEGKSGAMLFDVAFPPEDPKAVAPWRIMPMARNPERPWLIALDAALGGSECVAYLRTQVWSPQAQDALLELGSNDGVKAWLNGEVIHALNVGRGLQPGQDKVALKLDEGANTLLLAVYQQGGEWAACARLRTPDGKALEGLKCAVASEE